MPRKSNTDMIAALEAKLAEARAKEAEKSKTRATYLVEAIKAVDEKIEKAEERYNTAVSTAKEIKDKAIIRLEEKRADLDAELTDLAVETAEALAVNTGQPVFTEPVEVEEV